MKLNLFVLFLSTISSGLFSQENVWQKVYDNNGIEFSYKKVECHDVQNGIHEEYFLIQINNNSGNPVSLKWDYHLWNNDICLNSKESNSDIKFFEAKIAADESIEGSCDNKDQKGLHIFTRFLNYKTANPVTRFTVENVEVIFD